MPEGNIVCFFVIEVNLHTGCTHTFSGSDVDRAGDVGEALIHAHLQVDHPGKKQQLLTGCIV